MNSRALAVLAGLVLLVGCRDAQPGHGSASTVTSAVLPASSPVITPVGGGGGETPEGRAGEITATPAITVVTSALEAETPAPESDNRAREAERLTVRATGAAGPAPAPSATYATAEAEVWAAVQIYFPASDWAMAMRVARCESGGTFNPAIVGKAGEQGIWQILAVYHGAVPADIAGQAAQAARIVAAHSWAPWTCAR